MREIKFRGKSKGSVGAFIYGYYHFDASINKHFICDYKSLCRYEVIPESICQFSGFYDKNGNEIYEGDICDTDFMSGEKNKNEMIVTLKFILTPVVK